MAKLGFPVKSNPFEPRPVTLPSGDSNPNALLHVIGEVTTSWESTEVGYAYLFGFLAKPIGYAPAARRAYGSIISPKSRKEMIESAAEVFFHLFPSPFLEQELADYLKIYNSAASRRNDVVHGVIVPARGARSGFYLEANLYGKKRDVGGVNSPYAYTSAQVRKFSRLFSGLRMDVDAFQGTLREHYESSDPKHRERY